MRGGEEGLTWVGGLGRPAYGGCLAALRRDWRSVLRRYKGAGRFGVAGPGSIVHTVRQPGATGILRSRESLSGGQVLLGLSIGSGIIGAYRAKTDCAQPSVGGGNF